MRDIKVSVDNGDGNPAQTHTFTAEGALTLDASLSDGQEHTFPLAEPAQVLSGQVSLPRLDIAAGKVTRFDPTVNTTVELSGNCVVEGRLEMRPNPGVTHTLRFTGIDESRFVGGGLVPLDSDVGLWVMGTGVLDAQGTPKAGWNRTGTDPTWVASDEILAAPNQRGATAFTSFTAGQPVPTVTAPDGSVQATEILNLTRNVRIEGTPGGRAHVFLLSTVPQTIRYATFRYMGPRVATSGSLNSTVVLGRYPMHFHHAGDGTRGSLIEGCVVRDSSRAYAAHDSNGITFRDCIAYKVIQDAFWWDEGEATDDITWEHCGAFGVTNDPANAGTFGAFLLGQGSGNVIHDCVAVATTGFKLSAGGFHWPSSANFAANVWDSSDLVSHNNSSCGIFVWQNDHGAHLVDGFTGYHNGGAGIQHGAYGNSYRYQRIRCWGNGTADVASLALPKQGAPPQTWEDVYAESLTIAEHNAAITIANTQPLVFTNLRTRHLTVAEAPTSTKTGAGTYDLYCAPGWDLAPADVTVVKRVSVIRVHRSDGTTFEVA